MTTKTGSWFVVIYDSEAEPDSAVFLVESKEKGQKFITNSFDYHIEIMDYISKDDWKENADILHSICVTNPVDYYYVNYNGLIFFAGLYYKDEIINCEGKYAVVLASTYGYFDIYVNEKLSHCIHMMNRLYRRANIDSEKIKDKCDLSMEIESPEIFVRLKSGEEYFSHIYKIEKPIRDRFDPM